MNKFMNKFMTRTIAEKYCLTLPELSKAMDLLAVIDHELSIPDEYSLEVSRAVYKTAEAIREFPTGNDVETKRERRRRIREEKKNLYASFGISFLIPLIFQSALNWFIGKAINKVLERWFT